MSEEYIEDFEDMEIEEEEVEMSELEDKLSNAPKMGDPEWHDFVMGLLESGEIAEDAETGNKLPCCHGLRRIANILLGETSGGVKEIIYPNKEDPRRVVVVYELVITAHSDGVSRYYTEVSDASLDNTDPFFLDHAPATASTKAQARCLRNALLLKTVTADEIKKSDRTKIMGLDVREDVVNDYNDSGKIEDKQVSFINTLAKKKDIDVVKLIAGVLGDKKVEDLTISDGASLGKVLNEYRGGRKDIPDEFKGYNKNWKGEE